MLYTGLLKSEFLSWSWDIYYFLKKDFCEQNEFMSIIAWKVSVFGVFLVHIFFAFGLNTERMRENTEQKNSEYEHFTRCILYKLFCHGISFISSNTTRSNLTLILSNLHKTIDMARFLNRYHWWKIYIYVAFNP